jgi:hypothetical protein
LGLAIINALSEMSVTCKRPTTRKYLVLFCNYINDLLFVCKAIA